VAIYLAYTGSPYPSARLVLDDPDGWNSPYILVMDTERSPGYVFYDPQDTLPNGMNARQWARLALSHRQHELRPGTPESFPKPW